MNVRIYETTTINEVKDGSPVKSKTDSGYTVICDDPKRTFKAMLLGGNEYF